jgi:hypothetical protein
MNVENTHMVWSGDTHTAGAHLNDESVAQYVDALIASTTDALPPEVRDHVAECLECKMAITELYSILRTKDSSERARPAAPESRAHRSFAFPRAAYRIAAVLALALLAGVAGYLWLSAPAHESTTQRVSKKADTLLTQQGNGMQNPMSSGVSLEKQKGDRTQYELAASFTVDPNLEDLVGVSLRSEGVKVIAPLPGADVGDDISFEWKAVNEPTLTLHILNNTGTIVRTTKSDSPPVVIKARFGRGLYYWKLESDEELLYVGKFFVRK